MNWQNLHGYGLRAPSEIAIARVNKLNDGKLSARTFKSQQNEIGI